MAIVYQNGVAGKNCANPNCGWKPTSEFARSTLFGIPMGDGFKSRCRECFNAQKREERAARAEHHRETARNYVERNKDRIRELKRAHQKANPEKYDQALERYRESHREELNAKAKEWRDADLEQARERGRQSYYRNADKRADYSREYRKQNPEKGIAATNRRRVLKLSAKGSHTEAEWQALKVFYKSTCLRCGRQEPEVRLTRDHVIPLTQGGTDSIDNIQPLCARCNSSKNNKLVDYRNR